MFTWVIAATLALAAPAPTVADATPPAQIMALPAELQSRYQAEVLSGHPSQHARLERTVEFLFGEQGLGMTYRESATSTVAEAYATREANCLTFTLLFLALALVSVPALPQDDDGPALPRAKPNPRPKAKPKPNPAPKRAPASQAYDDLPQLPAQKGELIV